MKLISTNTTVALAGLLLLIPTAYGSLQYRCDRGDPLSLEDVLKSATGKPENKFRKEQPAIPTGDKYSSIYFTKSVDSNDIYHAAFLLQVYGDPPQYQLSQYSEEGWGLCDVEEIH
ncbi:putative candidate secreted effector protein [Blumeria hordei DH14]|uniref:Putative candidate secreted effector protein n=1 Tax=Blumeria graminis f. sp. hordei (strain DH14) TaxID=546991 RepID=N1J4R2_BLUG1|nr:putative candidate secreted effector protein [Blumeria hordei DH14]